MPDIHIGLHWHHIPSGKSGVCVYTTEWDGKLILGLDVNDEEWIHADVRECWPEDCAGAA